MNEPSLPALLKNTDTMRIGNYGKYLRYYDGQLPEPERQVTRWGRGVTLNYLKVFIDKATSYLMADMFFTINDSERPEAAARAEAALRKCYLDNHLDLLDLETETDCAILGDACYKVIWDEGAGRVRVTAPDVQGLWAWTRGDDINEIWRVATRYTLQPEALHKLHGHSAQTSQEVIEDWTAETFELWIGGERVRSQPNPYGFIPFVIYPNIRQPKSLWGASDIAALLNVQIELNRSVTQLSRILELSGNPIAVLENVDRSRDIAVTPGAVWEIPEDAKAYLLDLLQGGGVALHIQYIDQLYRAIHDLSETPRAAFGGLHVNLSGVAMSIELYSLTQKIKRKRLIRTSAYRKRNALILALLHQHTGLEVEGLEPEIVWGSILPQDLATDARTQRQLTVGGLRSRRSSMSELGTLDPETEWRMWLEEEAAIQRLQMPEPSQGSSPSQPAKSPVSNTAIPYRRTPLAPKDTPWDGPAEIKAAASLDALKAMCAWHAPNASGKADFKLPHHKARAPHPCVWNGVRAAAAALSGARGGADIPRGDIAAVKRHIERHYEEFGQDPPLEDEA